MSTPVGRPAIFGEVLFDCFSDQSSVLGGAPFNVAWHLQGFGFPPLLISRIGEDGLGDKVRRAMLDWGMSTDGLQSDAEHRTGVVEVAVRDGQPSFDILADRAYDHIDAQAALQVLRSENSPLLYHGSLITRQASSRAALAGLHGHVRLPCFVDINLRPPWNGPEQIDAALKAARWLKINDAELASLCALPSLHEDVAGLEKEACRLQRELDLQALIVTRGADGAFLVDNTGRVVSAGAARVDAMVDTVGAGDAFAAVMLCGLLSSWPLPLALQRAVRFAASVCQMRGATAADRRLYDGHLEQWRQRSE